MTDRPTAAELLVEARRTLLDDLLGLLPAERRYDGLMVANAMAIAVREFKAYEGLISFKTQGLAGLSGDRRSSVGSTTQDLERRLVADIRAGVFDAPGERRDAVRAYLRSDVLARLAISNPKALPDPR
jgi:hypothetical protein